MFSKLMSKADKIFYEPPGHKRCMDGLEELAVDESLDYYRNKLGEKYGDVIILDQRMVERKRGHRRDPLFYLDTSEY